jgi:hypothetical protein
MLEQQHAQNNLGRESKVPSRAALWMPPQEGLVNNVEYFLVFQEAVCLTHPRFPQIANGLCEEAVGKFGLRGGAKRNHLGSLSRLSSADSARSNC